MGYMLALLAGPNWEALDVIVGVLAIVVPLVVGAVVYYYRQRHREKELVRGLLTFLSGHRVLNGGIHADMYHPTQSAKSVRNIRIRLSNTLEQLSEGSVATRPIQDMYDACLEFLDEFESLPIPSETEDLPLELPLWAWGLLPDQVISAEWKLGGEHSDRFIDALVRMREVFYA